MDLIGQKLLLEGIFLKYGYDFRQYASASFERRVQFILGKFHFNDCLELLTGVLRDKDLFLSVLPFLTVTTTEFFRDPDFFLSLRKNILPVLRTYPHINIWIAGCSSGEEAYSLSILLREEGLSAKTQIYATDINPAALKAAKDGIYSIEALKTFAKNYSGTQGVQSPSDYYYADYGLVRFDPTLRDNIMFSEHNLAIDQVFAEMHLILCRNVIIYFNKTLQDRVLGLFSRALIHRGFLALGSRESLQFSSVAGKFEPVDAGQKIFRRTA